MESYLKALFGRQWPLLAFTSLIILLLYLILIVLDKVTQLLCSITLKSTRNAVRPLGMWVGEVQDNLSFENVCFICFSELLKWGFSSKGFHQPGRWSFIMLDIGRLYGHSRNIKRGKICWFWGKIRTVCADKSVRSLKTSFNTLNSDFVTVTTCPTVTSRSEKNSTESKIIFCVLAFI